MAQRVEVTLVDDIDQSPADETVSFALDGKAYEIDLNAAHADELRAAFARYVGHARKASGRRSTSKSKAANGGVTNPTEIREWAKRNGVDVPTHGRIPAAVREQFEAASA